VNLIEDERLREIVATVSPFLEGDRYPHPKRAPRDPTERDAWFDHVAERRANQHRGLGLAVDGEAPGLPGVDVREARVPVEGSCGWSRCEQCAAGAIAAFVYRPVDAQGALPAYVTFHGGGWWALGGPAVLRAHGQVHAQHAADLGVVVVDVDYRMTPEHKFPLPVEDCYTGLTWAVQHAEELGIDVASLAVGGGSAGGNLAAAVALMARDRNGPDLRAQLLQVPVTDSSCNSRSMRTFASGYVMSRQHAQDMWEMYLDAPADAYNPYASPLHALDVSGLPPALVVVGEYDVLRDEGLAYAERLVRAEVATTVRQFRQCHGAALPENGPIIEQLSREFLRSHLTRSSEP
jgi:acetyl esterase